jgi:tRNA uridine 5-carbamoylmethylation protein Kti12
MLHNAEMLVIFSGLPGVGKTAISRELARMIDAVHSFRNVDAGARFLLAGIGQSNSRAPSRSEDAKTVSSLAPVQDYCSAKLLPPRAS